MKLRVSVATLLVLGACHDPGDPGVPDMAGCEIVVGQSCTTIEKQRQAQLVRDYAAALRDATASPAQIDWSALTDDAARAVLEGDGTELAVFRALRKVHRGVPQGHQNLLFPRCGMSDGTPWAQSSWYGVCGRPRGETIVVTHAAAGNSLGLSAGDSIIATDRMPAGEGFLEAIAAEPVCGSSMPSRGASRESAAASFFGVLQPGTVLTVRAPDGTMRSVTAQAHDDAFTWCLTPFGGIDEFEIKVTTRPDGVAVARIPGFLSKDHPLPSPLTSASYAQWIADYVERLRVAIEPVKNAPVLVWDARSNTGGSGEVAMAIAAGMPGARAGVVSQGFLRIAGSEPFAFEDKPVASFSFSLAPGGPLSYAGKVIVLIDGLTYSAGDVFAHAVSSMTDAFVVGSGNAGAFGYGGNQSIAVEGPPSFSYSVDRMRSVDANGVPLEGTQVVPDVIVEYDPMDLAQGIDTVLETAIAKLP